MTTWFTINSLITLGLFLFFIYMKLDGTFEYQIRVGKYQTLAMVILLSCVGVVLSWITLGITYLVKLF